MLFGYSVYLRICTYQERYFTVGAHRISMRRPPILRTVFIYYLRRCTVQSVTNFVKPYTKKLYVETSWLRIL